MIKFIDNVISPYTEMLAFEILWAIPGMTETRMTQLFQDEDDTPSEILQSIKNDYPDIENLTKSVKNYMESKLGQFSICVKGNFQYPQTLQDARHPIELFYYKGNLDVIETKCISIVGTRKMTFDGERRTRKLVKQLVSEGYTIVSGLAKGIDSIALTTALEEKGNVIAVIGTPIDKYYPKENRRLQDYIAKNHLLISQVAFYRYEKEPFNSHRYYFPRRNATMSAISKATVIVEASEGSGTLIQARAALYQRRKLFILNSCFEQSAITWPGKYEKKGAVRVREIKDILDGLQE